MRRSFYLGLLLLSVLIGPARAVPCVDYENYIHYVGHGGFDGISYATVVAEFDGSNWGILAAGFSDPLTLI